MAIFPKFTHPYECSVEFCESTYNYAKSIRRAVFWAWVIQNLRKFNFYYKLFYFNIEPFIQISSGIICKGRKYTGYLFKIHHFLANKLKNFQFHKLWLLWRRIRPQGIHDETIWRNLLLTKVVWLPCYCQKADHMQNRWRFSQWVCVVGFDISYTVIVLMNYRASGEPLGVCSLKIGSQLEFLYYRLPLICLRWQAVTGSLLNIHHMLIVGLGMGDLQK